MKPHLEAGVGPSYCSYNMPKIRAKQCTRPNWLMPGLLAGTLYHSQRSHLGVVMWSLYGQDNAKPQTQDPTKKSMLGNVFKKRF